MLPCGMDAALYPAGCPPPPKGKLPFAASSLCAASNIVDLAEYAFTRPAPNAFAAILDAPAPDWGDQPCSPEYAALQGLGTAVEASDQWQCPRGRASFV